MVISIPRLVALMVKKSNFSKRANADLTFCLEIPLPHALIIDSALVINWPGSALNFCPSQIHCRSQWLARHKIAMRIVFCSGVESCQMALSSSARCSLIQPRCFSATGSNGSLASFEQFFNEPARQQLSAPDSNNRGLWLSQKVINPASAHSRQLPEFVG